MFDTLRDAWKNRKALGDGDKTRELSAFLPAALEIQETPPSPLARWLSRTIITLLVIGIVWALLGQVNIVASAQGKILPSSRTKVIQPLQKGIVKSILVKEGQRVTQGQPLIELDSTLTSADVNRLSQERENTRMKLGVNQALLERLQSEHTQEPKIQAQDQVSKAGSDKSTLTDPDYERLLQAQWRQYLARKQTLISAVEAAEAEIAGTKIEVQKLQKTLPIVTKRAKITKGLYEKNTPQRPNTCNSNRNASNSPINCAKSNNGSSNSAQPSDRRNSRSWPCRKRPAAKSSPRSPNNAGRLPA